MSRKLPPPSQLAFTLVRTSGPQEDLEVLWTRTTVRVYRDGRKYRRVEAKMPNRKGRIAVRRSPWIPEGRFHVSADAEMYRREMVKRCRFSELGTAST